MCDAFWSRYASVLNTDTPDGKDRIPSPIFFSGKNCTGLFWPNDGNGDVPVTNSTFANQGQTVSYGAGFTAQSVLVPFNYPQLNLTPATGNSQSILGPFAVSDLSSVVTIGPGATVTPVIIQNWDTVITRACNGDTLFVGTTPLSRYRPQSERCDEKMTDYCSKAENIDAEPCGCFKDLQTLQQANLALPVICFGKNCAAGGSAYHTQAMVSEPCNVSICKQSIINNSTVAIQDTDFTIYCNGRFFNTQGEELDSTTDQNQPAVAVQKTSSSGLSSNTISYIIMGVGVVLCFILVMLMFTPRPKPNADETLQKLERLAEPQTTTLDLRL